MGPATVFAHMTADPQSGGRRSSPAALRALFEQFTSEIGAGTEISSQLTAWSQARDQWRAQWNGRSTVSPEFVFRIFTPGPASGGQDAWTHPVADQAPELDPWRALWRETTPALQAELSATIVRAIELIDSDAASLADACALVARSTGGHGVPLAALTPAVSALDPVRFVVLCDAWLRTLDEYEGRELPRNVGAYPELNAIALRWLAAAEGDSPAPVLAACPPADRLGTFCGWIVRTTRSSGSGAKFDVTQRKYKDWPPMW